MGMGTPVYTLRLSEDLQKKVEEMSRLYGSKSPSEFVRDLIATVCSGDMSLLSSFAGRLEKALTGQLQLHFEEAVEKQVKKVLAERERPQVGTGGTFRQRAARAKAAAKWDEEHARNALPGGHRRTAKGGSSPGGGKGKPKR